MQTLPLAPVTVHTPGGLTLQTQVYAWIAEGFVPDLDGSFSGRDAQDLLANSIAALDAQIRLEKLVVGTV